MSQKVEIPLNKVRTTILLVLLLFGFQLMHGATDRQLKIDSLKERIAAQEDTIKLASIVALDYYLSSRNPNEMIKYHEIGFQIASKLDHLYYKAQMLHLKGLAHYFLGKYDEATEHWKESLDYFNQFTEEEYYGESRIRMMHSFLLLNMGVVSKIRGEYTAALDYYQKSLEIRKTTGYNQGVASCYVNIGNVYVENKNDEKALSYFKQAEEIYNETNSIFGQATVLNNIALIYKREKDLDLAKQYFEQSLKRYKEIDMQKNISQLYINLGLLYKDFDDCDQALDYFSLALIIKKEISDRLGVGWCYQYIGECYMHNKQYPEAMDYYQRALKIMEDLNVAKNQLACYKGLAEINAAMGDFEAAYRYKVDYSQLNDTVYSQDLTKHLAEQEARFASAEKEQELELKDLEIVQKTAVIEKNRLQMWALIVGILLVVAIAIIFIQRFRIESRFHKVLEKQNEELRLTYINLKDTVISKEEKEVMIKEIHHRVKNNLQIISSLINIQANNVEDKKVQRMFHEVQNRIISMSLLHEQLYKAPDLAHVNVDSYLEVLLDNLMKIFANDKRIALKKHIDVDSLSVDTLIPIGLLINEVVTNSLKYAFKGRDEGIIEIELKPHESGYILKISDNGIGMPENQLDQYKDSLGMELISTFVSQLDGVIEVDVSGGTSYYVEFYPISKSPALSIEKTRVPTS